MNQSQIEYLRKKIVDLAILIDKQLDEKRDLTKSYNETIKQSKKRMRNFASAVKMEDETILHDNMSETEFDEFSRII